ncbi:uncharacterized protein LOC117113643 [Anneissia japonica]|uniref:uncharacterized protein LOC117113643 n=1 Tax=Anneissia japonica TaxID=1529436 RepID=UPI0014256607|nr:uncharacterized protein LOC117113643 [Anneissia japonica]
MFSPIVFILSLIIDAGRTSNISELHIGGMFPTLFLSGVTFEECVDVPLLMDSAQHEDLLRKYTLYFHNINSSVNFIRHVILIAHADDDTLIQLLCQLYQRPTLPHVFFIFANNSTCNVLSKMICDGVSDWSVQDITCVGVSTLINSSDPVNDCAFAHDAALTTLHALNGSNPVAINSFISAKTPFFRTRVELNRELTSAVKNTSFFGKTGHVAFSVLGVRSANLSVCRLHQNGCVSTSFYDTVLGEVLQDPAVSSTHNNFDIISIQEVEIELSDIIYYCMVACAGLMALLAFVLLICNIKYRNNSILIISL